MVAVYPNAAASYNRTQAAAYNKQYHARAGWRLAPPGGGVAPHRFRDEGDLELADLIFDAQMEMNGAGYGVAPHGSIDAVTICSLLELGGANFAPQSAYLARVMVITNAATAFRRCGGKPARYGPWKGQGASGGGGMLLVASIAVAAALLS